MPKSHFRWGHKFNVLGFVVGDTSMIVSDGDDHTRRRSSVQSAFSRRRLNGWIPTILEHTDHMIDRLVENLDGTEREITPAALADLGDGDNNHLLCLATADMPVSVSFPAGVFVDPNKDLNPETEVAVSASRSE